MPALKPVPDDGLLKLSDVLRLLNVSRTALWHIRARGLLPSVHVGRALRFRPQDVERYIRLRTRKSLHAPPPGSGTLSRERALYVPLHFRPGGGTCTSWCRYLRCPLEAGPRRWPSITSVCT